MDNHADSTRSQDGHDIAVQPSNAQDRRAADEGSAASPDDAKSVRRTARTRRLRSSADDVFDRIHRMLVEHEIAPGQRLIVEALAKELGVSPTPVREALARLEGSHLVTRRSMAGWAAANLLDYRSFGELLQVRLLLEPEAAARAATQASDADLDKLRELTQRMHDHSGDEYFEDLEALITLDQDFHERVAFASRNDLLGETIVNLHFHAHMYRLYRHRQIPTNTAAEHARILEAIARGDPDRASEAMRSHIRRAHARLSPRIVSGDQ